MVKLNCIYTKTGDQGSTGLGDGTRVSKDAPRIHAIGSVDSANAAIGIVRLYVSPPFDDALSRIQHDLFDVGADLCLPNDREKGTTLRVRKDQVLRLESELDALNDDLAPLTSFVLPGGTAPSAYSHQARTAVRTAERDVITLHGLEPLNPFVLTYLNRLSDYLFVLGRYLNNKGHDDVLWVPGSSQ